MLNIEDNSEKKINWENYAVLDIFDPSIFEENMIYTYQCNDDDKARLLIKTKESINFYIDGLPKTLEEKILGTCAYDK